VILTIQRGSYGRLFPYDKSYDRVNTKLERPLQAQDRIKYNITTSDDPVMQEVKSLAIIYSDNGLTLALVAGSQRSCNGVRNRQYHRRADVRAEVRPAVGRRGEPRGKQIVLR